MLVATLDKKIFNENLYAGGGGLCKTIFEGAKLLRSTPSSEMHHLPSLGRRHLLVRGRLFGRLRIPGQLRRRREGGLLVSVVPKTC